MNRRLPLFLAVLFILLFASLTRAEQLVSSGASHIIVFKTQDMMMYGIKLIAAEPDVGKNYDPRLLRTIRCMAPNGTEVSVIKSSWLSGSHVRIMSGQHRGKTGWVPSEMVR